MQDKDLYVIAVLRYKKENLNLNYDELFPAGWDSSNNYHLKIEIIAEAIKNQVLIKDTDLYQKSFVGRCKILTNDSREM